MKTTTYNEMTYSEFDELVNKYFPMTKFEFVSDEDAHNYTKIPFGSRKKEDLKKWTEHDFNRFNEIILGKKGSTYCSHLFLDYFVGNEILPEGEYLIEVSW